jgi:hypothetical protein
MMIGVGFLYGPTRRKNIIFVGLWAAVLLVQFVLPLITQRRTEGYENKLAAHDATLTLTPSLIELGVRRAGVSWLLLVLILWLTISLAYWLGRAEATDQAWFQCRVNKPDTVVLRIYGDVVVDGKLEAGSKRLTGEFVVSRIEAGAPLEFQERHVGPLEPAVGSR